LRSVVLNRYSENNKTLLLTSTLS